jgi:branched-subunit amino acid ABC-type transport system permease component
MSIENLIFLVSVADILALPWHVGLTGLSLAALLACSAAWSILMLRPVRALTRIVAAFAILIILSQAGEAVVGLFNPPPPIQGN